jgi:hypothetical protein
MREMQMLFETREVDGESVPTAFGCLFFVALIPFMLAFHIIIAPLKFVYEILTGPFKERRRKLEANIRNQDAHVSFFANAHFTPYDFWLTEITYKTVFINKRSGGKRKLSIPNDDLKGIQRQLGKYLRAQIGNKVHTCANAYVHGRGTVANARPHLGGSVLLKLDIKDFFPSIQKDQLHGILASVTPQDVLVKRLTDLCYSESGLPQGAPTSPLLSNLVLRRFDVALYRVCALAGAKYTRYADDISISLSKDGSKKIGHLIKAVESELANDGFTLNKDKIRVLRPHQAQRICGVTINSGKPTISRKQRRVLRAAKHRQLMGKEASFTPEQIAGWEAYISGVSS